MDQTNPKISVEYNQDVIIVIPTEEKILEQSDIQALEDSIMPLIERSSGVKLIIDFVNTRFLTSAVLGLLIRLSKRVYESKGQFKLCCIDRKLLDVFRITRLDKVFEIYSDRRQALESFE